MALASLILSIAGLAVGAVGLLPLLGFLEIFALILAGLGFIFGLIPIVKRALAPIAIAGFVISIVVIVMAVVRLALGGWIF